MRLLKSSFSDWHTCRISNQLGQWKPRNQSFVGLTLVFCSPALINGIGSMSFAHRADVIANCWFDAGPTPLAQQGVHMPCNANHTFSQVSHWAKVGTTRFKGTMYNNSYEKLDFPNLNCLIAYNNLFHQPQ